MSIQWNWHQSVFRLMAPMLLLLSVNCSAGSDAQPTLETVKYTVNDVTLVAEIADDTNERKQGLSYRKSLEPNAGMLFVYTQEQNLYFTMEHASIPLSIAFLDKDMSILEILPMTPFTIGPYPSASAAQYALEMEQGWFEKNNIKPGDKLREAQ